MKSMYLKNGAGQLVAIVSTPDYFDQSITVNGRKWRFDFCRRFGPLWLKADGTERKNQNPGAAVWREFQEWFEGLNK